MEQTSLSVNSVSYSLHNIYRKYNKKHYYKYNKIINFNLNIVYYVQADNVLYLITEFLNSSMFTDRIE